MHDSSSQQAGSGGAPLSTDERTELEQLRAEISELRHRAAAGRPVAARRGSGWWRTPIATVLIMIGCLLAPVSVLAIWTSNQVSDTGRYVANVSPLISQPPIQRALTDKITAEITSHLDVQLHAQQAATALDARGLPRVADLLNSFSGPLADAVTGLIHSEVARVVASPRAAALWANLNQTAHEQLVKVMSGQGSEAVTVSNGQVAISLAPFIKAVQEQLAKDGFTLAAQLPTISPTIALFSAKDLSRAQTAYRLINGLKFVLPLAALFFYGLGIYVAKSRRRALMGASLGLVAAMLALGVGLEVARALYLRSVPPSLLPGDAAAALFDTLVRFIRYGLRLLAVVGIVIAIVAFCAGPATAAVRARIWALLVAGAGRLRRLTLLRDVRASHFGRWTAGHRGVLLVSSVAVAALIFLFWPALSVAIVLAVLLLLVLGLLHVTGRPGEIGPPSATPAA